MPGIQRRVPIFARQDVHRSEYCVAGKGGAQSGLMVRGDYLQSLVFTLRWVERCAARYCTGSIRRFEKISGNCASAWHRCCSRTSDPEGTGAQCNSPADEARASRRPSANAVSKISETDVLVYGLRSMHRRLGKRTCSGSILPEQPGRYVAIVAQPTLRQAEISYSPK